MSILAKTRKTPDIKNILFQQTRRIYFNVKSYFHFLHIMTSCEEFSILNGKRVMPEMQSVQVVKEFSSAE